MTVRRGLVLALGVAWTLLLILAVIAGGPGFGDYDIGMYVALLIVWFWPTWPRSSEMFDRSKLPLERRYRGQRDGAGVCAIEVLDTPDTVIGRVLPHLVRHSPTGLEWGYGGSGPADTSRSILADFLGRPVCPTVYHTFKFQVVANWPRDGHWELTGHEIAEHLDRIAAEGSIPCIFCSGRGVAEKLESDEPRRGRARRGDLSGYCDCPAGKLLEADVPNFESE